MREGNIFSLFVSSHLGGTLAKSSWEGVTQPGPAGGYPRLGGNPATWGTPPSQVRMGCTQARGTYPGYSLAKSEQGGYLARGTNPRYTPKPGQDRGYPARGNPPGVPPSQVWVGEVWVGDTPARGDPCGIPQARSRWGYPSWGGNQATWGTSWPDQDGGTLARGTCQGYPQPG